MGKSNNHPERHERIADGFDATIRESRRLRSEIGGSLETEREMAGLRDFVGTRRRFRLPETPDGGDDLAG